MKRRFADSATPVRPSVTDPTLQVYAVGNRQTRFLVETDGHGDITNLHPLPPADLAMCKDWYLENAFREVIEAEGWSIGVGEKEHIDHTQRTIVLNGSASPDAMVNRLKVLIAMIDRTSDPFSMILRTADGPPVTALAQQTGTDAEQLLRQVIAPQNRVGQSFIHPEFSVYRDTVNGKAISLIAKFAERDRVVGASESRSKEKT